MKTIDEINRIVRDAIEVALGQCDAVTPRERGEALVALVSTGVAMVHSGSGAEPALGMLQSLAEAVQVAEAIERQAAEMLQAQRRPGETLQ